MSPRFRYGGRMVACVACAVALALGLLAGRSPVSAPGDAGHAWAAPGGGGGHGK
jgi:hypothetical protein